MLWLISIIGLKRTIKINYYSQDLNFKRVINLNFYEIIRYFFRQKCIQFSIWNMFLKTLCELRCMIFTYFNRSCLKNSLNEYSIYSRFTNTFKFTILWKPVLFDITLFNKAPFEIILQEEFCITIIRIPCKYIIEL